MAKGMMARGKVRFDLFTELTSVRCAPSVAAVKFAKIHFADERLAAQALVGLAQRGRVVGLRDHTFIVPAPALEWLTENALPYQLIEWLNQDDVVQSPRNNLAHAA